jgi:hypothetical protein
MNTAPPPIIAHAQVRPSALAETTTVTDRFALILLFTPFVAVTFLSKFAVAIGGTEILLAVPLILAATLVGVFSGRLSPDRNRVGMFLGMAAILCIQQVFARTFQPTSLILLLALQLTWVFRLHGAGDAETHHRRVLNLARFFCFAGVVQYGAQFVIGPVYAYPIEHFTPDTIITHGYNYLNPLRYGSHIFKANGVFLLEPSYYSQMLSTGVVLEILGRRRLWSFVLFAAGFYVSFSGTGLIMLAMSLLTLALVQRRFAMLIGMAVAGFLILSFGEVIGLHTIAERSKEFQQPGTSGYQRYVGPVLLMQQYLGPSLVRTFFGVGSGMMMRMTPQPMFHIAETGWAKIIIEFGIVGALAFFGFLYTSIFGSRQSIVLRANLATMTLMSGILDGPPHGMILSLLLWATPRASDDVAGNPPPPVPGRVEARVITGSSLDVRRATRWG